MTTELAESLRIEELLTYMNDNLLDGQGVIEKTFRWARSEEDDLEEDAKKRNLGWAGDEVDDDEDDWDDDEDWDDEDDMEDVYGLAEFPVLSFVLSWKQAGQIQLNVELVGTADWHRVAHKRGRNGLGDLRSPAKGIDWRIRGTYRIR